MSAPLEAPHKSLTHAQTKVLTVHVVIYHMIKDKIRHLDLIMTRKRTFGSGVQKLYLNTLESFIRYKTRIE